MLSHNKAPLPSMVISISFHPFNIPFEQREETHRQKRKYVGKKVIYGQMADEIKVS